MLFASLILDFWGVLNVNLKFAKLYPVGIQLLTVAAFSFIASFFFFFLVIIIYLMCVNVCFREKAQGVSPLLKSN